MKKVFSCIIFICMLSLIISCGDDKKSAAKQNSETSSKNEIKREKDPSIVLYDGTPLYIENEEGKMVYADEVPAGKKISIYKISKEIEQKTAVRLLNSGKEDTFNFVHISYFNTDYWTRDIFITNDTTDLVPGVITSQVTIYSSPDVTSATTKKLEANTIVATNIPSITNDEDFDIKFQEITYYNGTAFGKKAYVKYGFVLTGPKEILAIQTLSKIEAMENIKPEIKETLLDVLSKHVYVDAFYDNYIDKKIDALK